MSFETVENASLGEGLTGEHAGLFRDGNNNICSTMTPAEVTLHINPAILEGVHHPSERAALVFHDALHAAEEYYQLFFTKVRDIDTGLRKRLITHHQNHGIEIPSEEILAAGRAWVNEAPGGSSSSSEEEEEGSNGVHDAHHGEQPGATAPHPHRRRRRAMRLTHVRNTPYHTFFPPPISARHSRAIICSLLQGRPPQPFANWKWSRFCGQQYPAPCPTLVPASPAVFADTALPGVVVASVADPATSTVSVTLSVSPDTSQRAGTHIEPTIPTTAATHTVHMASSHGMPASASAGPLGVAASAPSSARGTDPMLPSGSVLLPRTRTEVTVSALAPKHTSMRSRVESRYDLYDARVQAQAQAARPHVAAAAATTVPGHHGQIGLSHLPDLLGVSQTTTAEENHPFSHLTQGGTSTHGKVSVSTTAAADGHEEAVLPTASPTTPMSRQSTQPTLSASACAAAPLEDDVTAPASHFDVAAINAIEDPVERAQRMSELYDVVLEACKAPLVPAEPPSSPGSCTSKQECSEATKRAGNGGQDRSAPTADPATASESTTSATSGAHAVMPPPASFFSSNFLSENETTYTIPTSQQGPEYFTQTGDGRKPIIIIMVGLPARGKTFLAQKICRLLGWHGTKAKVHNVQVAWRRVLLDYEATRRLATKATAEATTPQEAHHLRTPSPAATMPQPSDPLACSLRGPGSSPCGSMAPHISSPASSAVREFPTGDGGAKEASEATAPPRQASDGPTDAGTASPASCLTADHFRQLLLDSDSAARGLYRYVLRGFAEDSRVFFESGGEVVVINDDFVTEELRLEAEALFQPYASQLFYMEVLRDEDRNVVFNECKINDPGEYPHDSVSATSARHDFGDRMSLLKALYQTLEKESDDDSAEDGNGCAQEATADHAHPRAQCARLLRQAVRRYHRLRYVKITNSSTMETHGISGYTASNIVSYVLNLSQVKMQHPIYFVRHGESCYNLEDRIGGDPLLTDQGMRDAAALLEFLTSLKAHLAAVDESEGAKRHDKHAAVPSCHHAHDTAATVPAGGLNAEKLELWTSQLRRAIQTAELSERLLDIKTLRWSSLNEIHAGVCEDMTYAEVKKQYPLIDHFRKQSKYTYRYPDGESYQDLVVRLESVIMELENADKAVVVVAHQAVLRCLLAYFGSVSAESSVRMKVPHRTVWRCTYDSKGIASLEELVLENSEAGFRRVQRLPGVDDALFVSEENKHFDSSFILPRPQ